MAGGNSIRIPEGREVTVECPYCHMLMHVPYSSAGVRATCQSCQGVTQVRFSMQGSPPAAKSAWESIAESAAIVLGLLFVVGGIVVAAGNVTGAFPTFPFAGFLVSGLGSLILGLSLRGGD